MLEMKNKKTRTSGNEDSQRKERHIVTWTQEEDDILREQISIHGTENWSIIASKFKDKTTRQCRRRWYTYLNSDFKKGGWTPEEDMLLCEAQKIFGNRWTEISKMVSGRTDNAVKNRFTTLCKKRAKYEALAKENAASIINSNNKRVFVQTGINTCEETSKTVASIKKMRRSHILAISENCNFGMRPYNLGGNTAKQQLRPPFAVLAQNLHHVNNLPNQTLVSSIKETSNEVKCNKTQETFLKKDDPKIIALMQQAELLSSLAQKVNADNRDESFESAWKVIQDFLDHSKEGNVTQYQTPDFDFQLENFRGIIEDLKSSDEGSQHSWRQSNLYESPSSSDYSSGSTILQHTTVNRKEQTKYEVSNMHQGAVTDTKVVQPGAKEVAEYENEILSIMRTQDVLPSFDEQRNDNGPSISSSAEFSSPLQVTPLFRSLAAGIPSPQFSESERHFLMKTLGMESPTANTSINPLPSPPCKRVLLHSL